MTSTTSSHQPQHNHPIKLSYKDILETFEHVVEKPKEEEIHITYEEWINHMSNKRLNNENNIKKSSDIAKNNYINDHLEQFIDMCEVLKDRYISNGFLNRVEYIDIANLCVKNMVINEINESASDEDDSMNDNIDD